MVAAICVVGVVGARQLAVEQVQAERQARFSQEAQSAAGAVKERLQQCSAALREAQALYQVTPTVGADQWRAFAAGLSLERVYPGVAGLAFIARVPGDAVEEFVTLARGERASFALRPAGQRGEYRVVKYIEPAERNAAVIGYDVGTIAVERQAMDRAVERDQPTLTGRFRLVQAVGDQAGAVLLLPVYRPGVPRGTAAQRRQAVTGWVAASIQLGPFLDRTLRRDAQAQRSADAETGATPAPTARADGRRIDYIDYCVYDQGDPVPFYVTADPDSFAERRGLLWAAVPVEVAGRQWVMECQSRPAFEDATSSSRPMWVLGIGVLLSIMLTALVNSITRTRERAQALAERITRSLHDSEAETRKLALIARSTDNCIVLMDAHGLIDWCNDSFTRTSGYNMDAVRGRRFADVMRQAGVEAGVTEQLEQQIRQGLSFEVEFGARTREGQALCVAARIQPVQDQQGQIIHYVCIGRDVSQRRQVEQLESDRRQVLEMIAQNQPLEATLQRLAELLRRQTTQMVPSILILRDGQIVQMASDLPAPMRQAVDRQAMGLTSALCRLPSAPEGKLATTDIASDPVWESLRAEASAHGLLGCWSMPIICGDGGTAGIITLYNRQHRPPTSAEGAAVEAAARIAALAIDHRQLTDLLAHRAQMDPLTGVATRALLDDCLHQALRRAQRQEQLVALLFIDLDRFKLINDTLGHQAGDQLLRQVCQRLQENLRRSDVLVRMGGDEFTLIVSELHDRQDAIRVAKKLLRALKLPFDVAGQELFICASIGIAAYPDDGTDAVTLQRNADTAMYRAKAQGGHTFVCFAPEMNVAARERLELENQLRRATEHGELSLYYQPQVERTGRLLGMEALLRWKHPRFGMVPPAKFIPLAEENGMIVGIGTWVLREACRQNKGWHLAGPPPRRVAVNVSALQFAQADFVDVVQGVLNETQLPPCWLELELTESLLMRNTRDAAAKLGQLRELGVGIAIDDFGTGYSSLAYLQQLPIDTIKIDRSFISDLGTAVAGQEQIGAGTDGSRGADSSAGGNHTAVIRAITSMAHSLGLDVIAEGVETRQQLEFLLDLGCNGIQGYLISKPLPPDDVEVFLKQNGTAATALDPWLLPA
jgi:diguanylate cyclase (GGDEF)-like protein/PAS domain S-box-containing protein